MPRGFINEIDDDAVYCADGHVKPYGGTKKDAMQQLVEDGYDPLSIADVMREVIEAQQQPRPVRETWSSTRCGVDTFDAAVRHPSKKTIKIVRDAAFFKDFSRPWKLAPEHSNNWGAMILPDGLYDKLEGPEFKHAQFEANYHHAGQVMGDPIWLALAGGDSSLLKEWSQLMEQKYERTFSIYVGFNFNFPKSHVVAENWELCGSHLKTQGLFNDSYGVFVGRPSAMLLDHK